MIADNHTNLIMRVALGTVVYSAAYKFHKDFVEAINMQNTEDFDILIINDNLSKNECDNLTKQLKQKVVWINCEADTSIQEFRIELINVALKEKYDLLILVDFDDTISENRISKFVSNYDSNYSFFYNDLYYMDSKELFIHTMPLFIYNVDAILESNFIGLSNSAINLNKIDRNTLDILKYKQSIAFDWMIFSILLINGHIGKKVDNCKTYYRIHEDNTAGNIDTSIDGLKKEIEIKVNHYSYLKDMDDRYFELYTFYYELKCSFEIYVDMLLRKLAINNQFWWGNIKKSIIGEIR